MSKLSDEMQEYARDTAEIPASWRRRVIELEDRCERAEAVLQKEMRRDDTEYVRDVRIKELEWALAEAEKTTSWALKTMKLVIVERIEALKTNA